MSSSGGSKRNSGAAWTVLAGLVCLAEPAITAPVAAQPGGDTTTSVPAPPRTISLSSGRRETRSLGGLKAGETYRLLVTLEGRPLAPEDRLEVELTGSGSDRFR